MTTTTPTVGGFRDHPSSGAHEFYRPIKEYIVGFTVTTATLGGRS